MISKERLQEIAKKFCDLYEEYSIEPIPVDRLLPEYRVSKSDIQPLFPEINLVDWVDLTPVIKREMKRRGIKWI